MIKNNEYYAMVYGRTNKWKMAVLSFFFSISSTPRLLIEVFLRRDMGIRYFSSFHCICVGLALLVLPFGMPSSFGKSWSHILLANWGWYLYLIAFGKCCWDRSRECTRPYGYFDFKHFSLSEGMSIRYLQTFQFMGKQISVRTKDVYLEPLLATGVGLFAFLTGQPILGVLLVISAGIYSMSYRAAYEMGRNYILDKIDQTIVNEDLSGTLLNNEPKASNFNFYGPKPSSSEVRKGLADLLGGKDEGTDVK